MKNSKKMINEITGTFMSNARGFGFVHTDEENEDIFIGADDKAGAMNGDTVKGSYISHKIFQILLLHISYHILLLFL